MRYQTRHSRNAFLATYSAHRQGGALHSIDPGKTNPALWSSLGGERLESAI
jgi:hypothetical protein